MATNKWTPALKKLATKELLAIANGYEVKRRKTLRGIRFNLDGSAKWSGQAHDYTVWIDALEKGLNGIKSKSKYMATAKKKPVKKRISAKKLCSKVITREGIKANGQLKPGYKWAAGGGRAIKVKPKAATKKKAGLRAVAPMGQRAGAVREKAMCGRLNDDGTTTFYTPIGGACPHGGKIVHPAPKSVALNGVKRKKPVAKRKPARK